MTMPPSTRTSQDVKRLFVFPTWSAAVWYSSSFHRTCTWMKLQCDREQTAHLQTALLHPDGCGPRYEPLSRTPNAVAGLDVIVSARG
jgi:hypothetical protein